MSLLKNGINFYRLGRLALKYTNPIILAFVLFWAAFSYGLWQQNKILKTTNQRLEAIQTQLIEQIENEAEAWLDYQQRLTQQQTHKAERNERMQIIVERPEVKPTANASIAPVLKHALNELRGNTLND